MATSYRLVSVTRNNLQQGIQQPRFPHLFTKLRRTYKSTSSQTISHSRSVQAKSPIDDYYAILLEQPFTPSATTERPVYIPDNNDASSSRTSAPSSNQPETKLEKGRIIFGSKLAGPAMRQKYIEDLPSLQASGQGTYIAGIWMPPKPTEPDNCCMSGCVNCVWDGYREELEEWIQRRNHARELAAKDRERSVEDAANRGDDDGAGVGSADWSLDNAMNDIPVGIREFMKTEKRLQQQRRELNA